MKNISCTLLIMLFFSTWNYLSALDNNLTVYDTYEDYVSQKGLEYEGDYKFSNVIILMNQKFINFKNLDKTSNENRKVRLKMKRIWGFQLGDKLFRIMDRWHEPVYVRNQGDFVYYENGIAILKMLKKGVSLDGEIFKYIVVSAEKSWSEASQFISKSLDDKIYVFSPKIKKRKIINEIPQIEDVHDCLKSTKGKKMSRTRKCIERVLK